MKKWIGGLFVSLALIVASVYIFIPTTIRLRNNKSVQATRSGLQRMLLDKKNIAKWWPGTIINDSLYYHGLSYQIINTNIPVLPVTISGKEMDLSTSLFLISKSLDSIHLEWVASIGTSYNPVKRFNDNLAAKKISNDMTAILSKMESFYSNPKNIYGYDIEKTLVADSMLISTAEICTGYPTTEFIYALITELRKFASLHSSKESGHPMLNIRKLDSVNFEVKVALPVDKLLPSSGEILQKKMLGRGYILVIEVKGGIEQTARAMEQLQRYIEDYRLKSPAIPFYSLITDRTKVQDSTKWITKIYFPVM